MSNLAGASGKTPARHESVESLLVKHWGETDPRVIIRRLARQKVAYAKSFGWPGPPFCPKMFTSIFGIRCKEVTHDIGGEGRIFPDRDGKLRIEYRADRMPERQRFTIFHEFAHTLFPDFFHFAPHHHRLTKAKDPDKEFENLCDVAAAEMLFPLENAKDDISRVPRICWEELLQLGKRYQASIDATTFRFVELIETVPCAAVFLTDQKGQFPGRGPLWSKYFSRNSLFECFISAGTSPPNLSVAIECYRNACPVTASTKETWWFNGNPRTWLVQATKLPTIAENPDYPKVVVLLLPSAYK